MRGVMMSTLIFVLSLTISCGTMNSNIEDNFPRDGFAFISKTVELKKCIGEKCMTMDLRSTGSGYVVRVTEKGAYIVTAAHVCDGESGLLETVTQKVKMKVSTILLETYDAEILKKDAEIDACLLFAEGLTTGVSVIPLAMEPPKKGERVYNLAAPMGVFNYDMVPIFEGRYAGKDGGQDLYTLPATFGSSGSMLLNSKGELVGMVHSVLTKFRNVAISSPFHKLMRFIRSGLRDASIHEWACVAPEKCAK